MLEQSPEGGFADEGVSLHVIDASDAHEYLRFDMFDDEPHYHYIHKPDDGSIVNNVIDFDVPALAVVDIHTAGIYALPARLLRPMNMIAAATAQIAFPAAPCPSSAIVVLL